jgi:hypothetical protein
MAGPATPVVIVGILVRELLRRRTRRPPAPRNCRTGNCRDTVPEEWHHEFPQQFRRSHFRPLAIDIDARENGRVIPRPQHRAIHGAGYNRDWDGFLADLPPRAACFAFRDEMVAAYHLYLFRRPAGRYPRK